MHICVFNPYLYIRENSNHLLMVVLNNLLWLIDMNDETLRFHINFRVIRMFKKIYFHWV